MYYKTTCRIKFKKATLKFQNVLLKVHSVMQVFKVYLTQIWKSFYHDYDHDHLQTMKEFKCSVLHHHHHHHLHNGVFYHDHDHVQTMKEFKFSVLHHLHHLHNGDYIHHHHHHLHNGDYIFTAITYAPIHSLCSLCGLQMQIRLIKSLLNS